MSRVQGWCRWHRECPEHQRWLSRSFSHKRSTPASCQGNVNSTSRLQKWLLPILGDWNLLDCNLAATILILNHWYSQRASTINCVCWFCLLYCSSHKNTLQPALHRGKWATAIKIDWVTFRPFVSVSIKRSHFLSRCVIQGQPELSEAAWGSFIGLFSSTKHQFSGFFQVSVSLPGVRQRLIRCCQTSSPCRLPSIDGGLDAWFHRQGLWPPERSCQPILLMTSSMTSSTSST